MDNERPAKASSFSFPGATNVQEPSRMFKNAYAISQFHKNHLHSSPENYYSNYSNTNNNNGGAGNAQFHHQTVSTTNYSSNALININNINSSNNNYFNTNFPRQRFTPYYNKRSYANALMQQQQQQQQQTNQYRYQNYFGQQHYQQQNCDIDNSMVAVSGCHSTAVNCDGNNNQNSSLIQSTGIANGNAVAMTSSSKNSVAIAITNGSTQQELSVNGSQVNSSCVTLQISNLDSTYDEHALKQYLINKLKPITSVISIYFETISVAKIKLPSPHHAKQVISFLHRKKIGHKRITVSYTRESSSMEPSTLRCQVVGILKDIPNYKLSMFKFREIFQSRFKTSISVIDLYEMKDICTIIENKNEDKYITLRAELINSIENSDLVECLQHSVPYCTVHFVKTHRGWAEQEIDPLPNVVMTVPQIRTMIYSLLRGHKGDIPIASIIHCIQSELQVSLERNETGVNFEHLITCVSGVHISSNKFGIKILSWLNPETASKEQYPDETSVSTATTSNRYSKYGNIPDSFSLVSREIIDLIKMSPKSTLKFSRFIPAYHNHFGKQCRVADYGYTKLIDLFEALSSVVQVMGEGENRQITLTHKMQVRRFTSDLLRVLRTQSTKTIMLSQLSLIFEQVQAKKFDITDYGVCDIKDILDGLVNSNVVIVSNMPHIMDIMISIPKRKQSTIEIEKTSIFAGEVVELLKHSSQYTILFEKFACSYHYHFGYQCRLCDYGFVKLADLMEAITGLVEMEFSNDEDRKIFLSPKIAQRVFSEQLKYLTETYCGTSESFINLHEVLVYHKKNYGYQVVPQSLGFDDMLNCIKALPYIELISTNGYLYIKSHHDDQVFRQQSYAACRLLIELNQEVLPFTDFNQQFAEKFNDELSERIVESMKHAIEINTVNDVKCVSITKMMKFIIHIISVIESCGGTMKIQHLQNALDLPINGCFSFGFPNLWSMIQSFPDIFVTTTNKPINFRGEIELNTQCILTTAGFITYMQYSSDLNNNNNTQAASNYSPEQENFLSVIQTADANHNSSGGSSGGCSSMMSSSSMNESSTIQSQSNYMDQLEINIHPAYENISTYAHNQSSTAADLEIPMAAHSTKMETSNHDFEMSHFDVVSISKLDDQNRSYGMPKIDDHSSIKVDEISMQRSFDGKDHSNSRKRLLNLYYDPPKPDTPPSSSQSKKLPFWLDPIWGLEQNSPKLNTLNVKIPDLKLFNHFPKLNTPLAMASLAKRSKFSFDYNNNQENII